MLISTDNGLLYHIFPHVNDTVLLAGDAGETCEGLIRDDAVNQMALKKYPVL